MTYRSESEALRARADSLEQDLQRQKVEVAEGRAAKAKAHALEQELEHARAQLAKLERRLEPKPRASSPKRAVLAFSIISLAAVGGASYFFMARGAPERETAAVAVSSQPPAPVKPAPVTQLTPEAKTAEVAVPAVRVGGTSHKAAIRRVIRRHLREVKFCYERELVKQPKLGGKLVFRWTIGKTGAVTSVKLQSSTIAAPGTANCILRRIRRWRFPPPAKGPVEISYPFVFRSSGS
jgi:hypothetical protein